MVADTDGRPVLEADQLVNPTSMATLDLAAARATPPSPVPSSVGGSGAGGTPPDSVVDRDPERSHPRPGLSRPAAAHRTLAGPDGLSA